MYIVIRKKYNKSRDNRDFLLYLYKDIVIKTILKKKAT